MNIEPLSRDYLISQGECCGSCCTNCPYKPKHLRGSKYVEFVKKSL